MSSFPGEDHLFRDNLWFRVMEYLSGVSSILDLILWQETGIISLQWFQNVNSSISIFAFKTIWNQNNFRHIRCMNITRIFTSWLPSTSKVTDISILEWEMKEEIIQNHFLWRKWRLAKGHITSNDTGPCTCLLCTSFYHTFLHT